MENLEEKYQKVDWKEWLPFWGFPQFFKDEVKGKPTIISDDPSPSLKDLTIGTIWATYQGISYGISYIGISYSLEKLIQKIF